ncbi:ester cyclase [Izhakiella australiensis]|uniref:Ester cyclase n=1 Tax=Izhakiella australiensis TaxID=1926881 RepID=A0A1S8YSX1_9GAMM|nr:ester cyclase [Izhakiella australiensis]OON41948.1 ester cyclase [Izhakiella australiensis]
MDLRRFYHGYIACLNQQNWDALGQYVAPEVRHNQRPLGLAGYRAMLIKDFQDIPDLRFVVETLVCEPPLIAARLAFNCTPSKQFLGLDINGRRLSFAENVFYQLQNDRIIAVQSVIDKAAIEQQISP